MYCGFFMTHLRGERFVPSPKGEFLEMPKIKIGCGIQRMPQPFFCDQSTPIDAQECGKLPCRSSDSCLSGRFRNRFSLPRDSSSDWLSPKKRSSAHTAAVPFGIHTRLSCSAAGVQRPHCHKAAYEVKLNIAPSDSVVKYQKSRPFPDVFFD